MGSFVEGCTKSFVAGAARDANLRVYLSGTTLTTADAATASIGVQLEKSFSATEHKAVRLKSAEGTSKMVAAGSITAGAPVFAAAAGKIASSGNIFEGIAMEAAGADGDVIEVLHLPATQLATQTGLVRTIRRRCSLAEINAGVTLLAAIAGYKYRLVDAAMIAIGGGAAAATTIDILATQSASSVKLVANAVAGLTQNTLLRAGASNSAILAGGVSFVANDANTAITVGKTGSDMTTATHIDVLVSYALET